MAMRCGGFMNELLKCSNHLTFRFIKNPGTHLGLPGANDHLSRNQTKRLVPTVNLPGWLMIIMPHAAPWRSLLIPEQKCANCDAGLL